MLLFSSCIGEQFPSLRMGKEMKKSFLANQFYNPKKRNLKKVPFVEFFGNRIQGVVSSGSDIRRVYVTWIEAGTGNYYCSTNNNRPCSGLNYSVCKHLDELVSSAVSQYGLERVQSFMGCSADSAHYAYKIVEELGGVKTKRDSGEIFSRFLDYLNYVELGEISSNLPEMAWFVGG